MGLVARQPPKQRQDASHSQKTSQVPVWGRAATPARAVATWTGIPLLCWPYRQMRGKWSFSAYTGMTWMCSARWWPSAHRACLGPSSHYTNVPI